MSPFLFKATLNIHNSQNKVSLRQISAPMITCSTLLNSIKAQRVSNLLVKRQYLIDADRQQYCQWAQIVKFETAES
jgi:hypothetical protein